MPPRLPARQPRRRPRRGRTVRTVLAASALVLPLGLSGIAPVAQPAAAALSAAGFRDLGPATADGPLRLLDDDTVVTAVGVVRNGAVTAAPTPAGASGPMTVEAVTTSGLAVGYANFDSGATSTRAVWWRIATGATGAYSSPCSDVYPQPDGSTVTIPEYYIGVAAAGDGDEVVARSVTCYPGSAPANGYVTLASPAAGGVPLAGVSNDLNASIDAVNAHWILQSSAGSADTDPETRINRSGGSVALPIQSDVGVGAIAPDGTAVGQDRVDTTAGDVVAPDGTVTRLAVPAGRIGGGAAINAAHVIIGGTAVPDASTTVGFSDYALTLWPSPTAAPVDLRSLLPTGWKNAVGFATNTGNDIVGGALAPDGKPHVFLLTGITLHRLSGRVTDGLGTPIAGATVRVVGANGQGGGTVTSAADGTYQLLLPATAYAVTVKDAKGNGYDPGTATVDLSAADGVASFMLTQQLLTGRVVANSCGTTCRRVGLAGVSIAVKGTSVAGTAVAVTATTAADGTWSQRVPRGSYQATPTLGSRAFDPEGRAFAVSTADVPALDYQTCASDSAAGTTAGHLHPRLDAAKLCPYSLDWTMPDHLTDAVSADWAHRYAGLPSPTYIYPKDWEADVFLTQNGRPLTSCAGGLVWRWSIVTPRPSNSAGAVLTAAKGCKVTLKTPTLGTYTLRGSLSRASDPLHKELAHATGKVVVKDLLIAAVGDSNGSGEGNPTFYNAQCNRSFRSYQYLDAQRVEAADRRTSVTLIFVSCSGATVENLTDRRYAGIQPNAGGSLPPQLEQVSAAIREPLAPGGSAHGRTPRTVDAVLTSIGVNNLSFGPVLKFCTLHSLAVDGAMRGVPQLQCENQHVNPERAADGSTSFGTVLSAAGKPTLDAYVRGTIERLTGQFAAYKRAVVSTLGASATRVVMTTYPDFTTGDDRQICGSVADLVTHPFPAFSRGEWAWLKVMGDLLNRAVDASAVNGFKPVDGISQRFIGHGYCARDTYIRPFPRQTFVEGNPDGPFHPTEVGHAISAAANLPVLCRVLFGNTTCRSKAP